MVIIMKALSLRQPWASLVAGGQKTIETRTWKTNYRGDLLIVASAKPRIKNLPTGQAIAIVNLVGCRKMRKSDEKAACVKLYPRANAWLLTNVRRIQPFPVKGRLGIFTVKHKVVIK